MSLNPFLKLRRPTSPKREGLLKCSSSSFRIISGSCTTGGAGCGLRNHLPPGHSRWRNQSSMEAKDCPDCSRRSCE
eukprot:414051-Prorocentrum_minimum.AAC.1